MYLPTSSIPNARAIFSTAVRFVIRPASSATLAACTACVSSADASGYHVPHFRVSAGEFHEPLTARSD